MMQIVFVGLGAGLATALLFASVASGSLLSIVLFYLAPLPILIAALGWSHWSALVAAVSAAAGLALGLGPFFFIAFLLGIGLPAWWLGYLTLLARPEPAAPDGVEWYPAGRIVVWAAILGALVVIATIPNFGLDEESFRAGLRSSFERMLKAQSQAPREAPLQLPGMDPTRLVDFLAAVIPVAGATIATLANVFNLWLAGRIVRTSGRLKRPWPDLPSMRFPPFTPALFAVALAATFSSSIVGTIGSILAASLAMAYAMLGFSVLHAVTRGVFARSLLLGMIYGAALVLIWPVLLPVIIGIADTIFDLRSRAVRRGPPAPPSQ